MNTRENQKYRQTHENIMTAVIGLLETKQLKQITVAEVCRLVHINRTTFYEHFLDIQDVLSQMSEDIIKNLDTLFHDGEQITEESMIRLFEHVYEYRSFYRICFDQGLDLPISYTPQQMPREGGLAEYSLAFFHAGLNALLRHWLTQNCRETPQELYRILEELMGSPFLHSQASDYVMPAPHPGSSST